VVVEKKMTVEVMAREMVKVAVGVYRRLVALLLMHTSE
jgi:hypothetical protein